MHERMRFVGELVDSWVADGRPRRFRQTRNEQGVAVNLEMCMRANNKDASALMQAHSIPCHADEMWAIFERAVADPFGSQAALASSPPARNTMNYSLGAPSTPPDRVGLLAHYGLSSLADGSGSSHGDIELTHAERAAHVWDSPTHQRHWGAHGLAARPRTIPMPDGLRYEPLPLVLNASIDSTRAPNCILDVLIASGDRAFMLLVHVQATGGRPGVANGQPCLSVCIGNDAPTRPLPFDAGIEALVQQGFTHHSRHRASGNYLGMPVQLRLTEDTRGRARCLARLPADARGSVAS
jgi:hypothetical protein